MLTGTWVTEGTEVYTRDGWVPIETIVLGEKVMVYNQGEIQLSPVRKRGKINYKGRITQYRGDFTLNAKNLNLGKQISLVQNADTLHIRRQVVDFNGCLFQVETEFNELLVRGTLNGSPNNDYVICLVN